jgi:hypothetical protein
MPVQRVMRRSRAIELDAEKAASVVELEGDGRREELEGVGKGTRFELEGELGNINKAVNVVVRGERLNVQPSRTRGEVGITKAKSEGPKELHKESRLLKNEPRRATKKAIPVQRDLPPLPTYQGKPGCGREETEDNETMRETIARMKGRCHYSVGPDGSYNYR